MHGEKLVLGGSAKPRGVPPEALASLTFPGGIPLSPALQRWLAFDASWFGWFEDIAHPVFAPRKLGVYARDEYEMDWGYSALEARFPGDCYGLAFGSDSRRFLYVGEPDSTGEHPVLLLDVDDIPYIGVQYPGIDVYLALHAGVIKHDTNTYGDLLKHRTYGPRMKEHAKRYFDGEPGKEIFDFEIDPSAFQELFAAGSGPIETPKPKAKPKAKATPKVKPKAKAKAKPKAKATPKARR